MNISEYIQISDLRHLRYGFYKLIYIRPTQLCPAKCRHCSANSGPDVGKSAPINILQHWVRSICEIEQLEWIGVEGGEPFVALPQLRLILDIANSFGKKTSVLTNAIWAENMHIAELVIKKLPRISYLLISADEFHQEFIPLERVINALKIGREYCDRIGVQLCVGPGYSAFLQQFLAYAGDEITPDVDLIETPLQYVGRAKSTGCAPTPEFTQTLPEGPCIFLGTPVVRENGSFVACCQQDVVLGNDPDMFHLGNLTNFTARELMAKVDSDIYLQTLRIFGPSFIANVAQENGWNWKPKEYVCGLICDLCCDLANHPDVVEKFRNTYNSPNYLASLTLGRHLLYDEKLP